MWLLAAEIAFVAEAGINAKRSLQLHLLASPAQGQKNLLPLMDITIIASLFKFRFSWASSWLAS